MLKHTEKMQNVFWEIIEKFEKIAFKYKITGLKTPTGRRHPVGYLQAWPRISTRDDREQIQLASGQSVTRTRDRGTASPTRWPLGHAAVIVSDRKTVEGTVKENENETYRLLGHNAFIFFLPCSMLWSRADNKKNKLLINKVKQQQIANHVTARDNYNPVWFLIV